MLEAGICPASARPANVKKAISQAAQELARD